MQSNWFLSKYQLFVIKLQRFVDHLYRRITGMPQVKRSLITPNIYVGGQYSRSVFNRFDKLGITAVVNMRMHSIHKEMDTSQVHILNLPTPDQTPPTQENFKKGVEFIQKELDAGGKVYIHCMWGEGRGPSMAIAYLMSTGMTFDDAYEHVRKVRTFINPTADQIAALKEFERNLKQTP